MFAFIWFHMLTVTPRQMSLDLYKQFNTYAHVFKAFNAVIILYYVYSYGLHFKSCLLHRLFHPFHLYKGPEKCSVSEYS